MARGPHCDLANLEYRWPTPCKVSFRVLSVHVPQCDEVATRIDVKLGENQFTVALPSSGPIEPQRGAKIGPNDDLLTPANGVLGCFNTKVEIVQLIDALKELLSDLIANVPKDYIVQGSDAAIKNFRRLAEGKEPLKSVQSDG